MKMVSCRAE